MTPSPSPPSTPSSSPTPSPTFTTCFKLGDYIEKYTGEARYKGHVVAIYVTRRNPRLRLVVEVEPQGFQMIVSPEMLRDG